MKQERKQADKIASNKTMHDLLLTECECAADKHADKSRVKLSQEDSARMQRIFEEINCRLVEAAGIISRNLGTHTMAYSVARVTSLGVSKDPLTTARARSPHPLLVCDIAGNCGYWDYESGECYGC